MAEKLSRLSNFLKYQWKYYFSWVGMYDSVLWIGRAFADYAFVSILILFLKEVTDSDNLRMVVAISMGFDCLKSFLSGIFLCVLEAQGPAWEKIIIIAFEACLVTGCLVLSHIASMELVNVAFIYLALLPLLVGTAGEGFLDLFLYDDIKREMISKQEDDDDDDDDDDMKAEDRTFFWKSTGRSIGAFLALQLMVDLNWELVLRYSGFVIGGCTLVFTLRISFSKVLRSQNRPTEDSQSEQESASDSTPTRLKIMSKQDFLKQHLKLLLLWAPIMVCGMVQAATSTFFFEQLEHLEDDISIKIIPDSSNLLLWVKKLTSWGISLSIPYVFKIKFFSQKELHQKRGKLVVVILGFVVCFCCCIAAWHSEVRRLHLIDIYSEYIAAYDDFEIPMGRSRLVLQFFLSGMMEGLLNEGVSDFFNHHFFPNLHKESYRCSKVSWMTFNNFLGAAGFFLSVLLILNLKVWIKDEMDSSRFDNYSRMLAFLTLLALFVFVYFSNFYISKIEKEEEEEEEDLDVDMKLSRYAILLKKIPPIKSVDQGVVDEIKIV